MKFLVNEDDSLLLKDTLACFQSNDLFNSLNKLINDQRYFLHRPMEYSRLLAPRRNICSFLKHKLNDTLKDSANFWILGNIWGQICCKTVHLKSVFCTPSECSTVNENRFNNDNKTNKQTNIRESGRGRGCNNHSDGGVVVVIVVVVTQ